MNTFVHKLRAGARLFGVGVRLPAYVLFFVTHRCDAKCGHCFFWRQLNDRSFRELDLAEINALARSLGPTLQVTLTGGSPELRSDLPDIAQAFHRHCRPANLTLCFNGYHSERIVAQVREMLDRCPGQRFTTGVSLDGIGEVHERLRGMPGLFDRVVRTVHELQRLKVETGRLQLVCAICISELNHADAEETARWVWKNLPVDLVKPILVRGVPQNPGAIGRQAVQTYLRLVESQRSRLTCPPGARRSWFEALVAAKESVQRELICRIAQHGQSPVRCSATYETAVIYANGNVAGCELRDEVLGNLRDVGMSFKRLWHGALTNRFREAVRRRQCTCYHHCFIAPLIFRSPRFWLRLGRALHSAW